MNAVGCHSSICVAIPLSATVTYVFFSEFIEVLTLESRRPKGPVRGGYRLQNQMYIDVTPAKSLPRTAFQFYF
jgi:hypothetical protein